MGLEISAKARPLGEQVWLLELPPHQVRFFGETRQSTADRSVIAIREATYNSETQRLTFDASAVTTLNVGTLHEAVAIGGAQRKASDSSHSQLPDSTSSFGPGDREFLRLASELLPKHMQEAAQQLLREVRQRSGGDLVRGKARNFSDTPDNFWYVVVQPQVQHLQITVRGSLQHFEGIAGLELKDDRGNTRFKITRPEDVPDGLKLIFHAKRRQ